MPQSHDLSVASSGLTRRTFLGTTILVGGAATLTGCFGEHHGSTTHTHGAVPEATLRFFTDAEAAVVDAVASRLIPGDADDPGAHEAGVVFYIDGKLADHDTFAEPTFTGAPFAKTPGDDGDGIVVSEDQLYRYGFQGADVTPREFYRDALAGLDRFSREHYGGWFVELSPDVQDQVLVVLDDIAQAAEEPDSEPADAALASAAEDAFGEVDPGAFFQTIRTDAIEGMFADPQYGGNRSMVGWALIGYPGANRGWSPEQMLTPSVRRPSALHDMPEMNPDQHGGTGLDALEQSHEGVVEG